MSEASVENLLSSVMENEDLMKRISDIVNSSKNDSSDPLPSVIDAIKGNIDDKKAETNNKTKEENLKAIENFSAKDDSILGRLSANSKKNIGLLTALKPFLSSSRADMIDNIIKVERLAELIRLTK